MSALKSAEGEPSRRPLILKFGIPAAVGVVAIYFAVVRGGTSDSGQLDTAASASDFVCQKCGHSFKLTPAGFDKLLNSGGVRTEGNTRGGPLLVRCPECKSIEGAKAARCPKDQSLFPVVDKNAQPGKCPRCGWSPPPPQADSGESSTGR